VTGGSKRYAAEAALRWEPAKPSGAAVIQLDPARRYQEILGFGAALTDSACYTLNRLAAPARERLFRNLFHPSEMGLNTCRICIGSSDYAAKPYSYDEGEPDPELRRFSIDHDREYILPTLRFARQVNPNLFLLASPWSPPGWMKTGSSLFGGTIRRRYLPSYAQYLVKFLRAYATEGVPVDAVTSQNEVDTDQDGRMPACLWGQEYEIEFVAQHLGPALARNNLSTRIWLLDHNYNLWGRALAELENADVRKYADGVAWHGYVGEAGAMARIQECFPDKGMYFTEDGPEITDPAYATDWVKWAAGFANILRNRARCIIAWNFALDEKGRPNIGPFSCGGLVTINAQTQEITHSGQYHALNHYSRAAQRGARRFESAGDIKGVSHVGFSNPDGSSALILANAGGETKVQLALNGLAADVPLAPDSVTTLTWR